MRKIKLISLLSSLPPQDFKQFIDFIRSPYHNPNPELTALMDYLQKLYPRFPEDLLSPESINQNVPKLKGLDKKALSYRISALQKLTEEFLGFQELKRKKQLVEVQTLRALTRLNAEKDYKYLYGRISKEIIEKNKEDSDKLYYKYLLADIATDHFGAKEVRSHDENIQIASNSLDDFYFLQKLKYSCEMLNRQAILSEQFSIPFMEQVEQYLSQQGNLSLLTKIYLQIYYSILHPDQDAYFTALIPLMQQSISVVSKEELRAIYLYAINISVRKIRMGKSEYLATTLNLYLEGIETKAIYDNDYLSHWTYDNTLKLALRLQKFELFEEFIHRYNKELKPQFRKDALQYNLAEFYFLKGDNEQTIYHLNKVEFTDIKYIIGSRVLLIKTYYRSNAYDPMLSALASFTMYMKRKKDVAVSFKAGIINFCTLLNQILRQNHKKKEQLKQSLQETQPLIERPWLLKVYSDTFS